MAISNRGGHAGLIVSGLPSRRSPQDVLAQADLVLIDLTTASGDDPRQVAFGLKTQSTAVRARGQGWRADWDPGVAAAAATAAPRTGSGAVSGFRGVARCGRLQTAAAPAVWRTLRQHQHRSGKPWRRRPRQACSGGCGGCPRTTPWLRRDGGCRAGGGGAASRPRSFGPRRRGVCRNRGADLSQPGHARNRCLGDVRIGGGPFGHAASAWRPVRAPRHRRLHRPGAGANRRGSVCRGRPGVGARSLTVAEIVARHQAAAARQAAAVRNLISRGTLTLSFEAPGFPAPVAITL